MKDASQSSERLRAEARKEGAAGMVAVMMRRKGVHTERSEVALRRRTDGEDAGAPGAAAAAAAAAAAESSK